MGLLTVRIRGHSLPGRRSLGLPGIAKPCYEDVHVGIQRGGDVVDLVPGDAAEAVWQIEVRLAETRDGAPDFRGPHVHGKPGERFLYLSWGELTSDGTLATFRRAKLHLSVIDPDLLWQAVASGGVVVEGRLGLTDARGGPLCASVRPPAVAWSVVTE